MVMVMKMMEIIVMKMMMVVERILKVLIEVGGMVEQRDVVDRWTILAVDVIIDVIVVAVDVSSTKAVAGKTRVVIEVEAWISRLTINVAISMSIDYVNAVCTSARCAWFADAAAIIEAPTTGTGPSAICAHAAATAHRRYSRERWRSGCRRCATTNATFRYRNCRCSRRRSKKTMMTIRTRWTWLTQATIKR